MLYYIWNLKFKEGDEEGEISTDVSLFLDSYLQSKTNVIDFAKLQRF